MIVQQTVRRWAVPALIGALVSSSVYAQENDGGITLGNDADNESTLDLGARPAPSGNNDQPQPAADDAPAASGLDTPSGPRVQAPDPSELVKHGDWEVYCPEGTQECLMAQLGSDDAGSQVLEMNIRKLPQPLEVEDAVAVAVLDVIVPLGVVLTAGLSIAIDSNDPEFAAYQICLEQGCLVREPIDENLVNRLRRGGKATVTMVGANEGDVSSVISLKGFTAAFAALK